MDLRLTRTLIATGLLASAALLAGQTVDPLREHARRLHRPILVLDAYAEDRTHSSVIT